MRTHLEHELRMGEGNTSDKDDGKGLLGKACEEGGQHGRVGCRTRTSRWRTSVSRSQNRRRRRGTHSFRQREQS